MLTMDEARGIAATIWTRSNNKRKVMDPQLCEDIADVLVDEVSKVNLDPKELDSLKETHEKLKTLHTELQDENDKLKERIVADQETWQEAFNKIQAELKEHKLNYANLQSDFENLKLGKKDEVV